MSVDAPASGGVGIGSLPEPELEKREAPEPAAHGSATSAVFNDLDVRLDLDVDDVDQEASVYDAFHQLWRNQPGGRDLEPYVVAVLDADEYEWLHPPSGGSEWVLVLTSSRWKAGTGTGDDHSAYYEYHLKLRERDDDGELHKAPIALHIEIMPQYADLVYKDGNSLECPFGEGTRAVCWTTWAETSEEIEARMLDGLEAAVGADRDALEYARDYESRQVVKAEAHHRVDIEKKQQLIEVIEQSKALIAFGGGSEIDAHQTRIKEGWLEAVVDADRWHLLGFDDRPWSTELKLYQFTNWHKLSRERSAHHPKLEASFAGTDHDASLPHVDEWDTVLEGLRAIVSAHLEWAGVERDDLVADEYQKGPASGSYVYHHPTGRREMLRERYEAISTEIYREALKSNTTAVYDILRTVAVESGATYDLLEERTGLARSTIRYHVRRLVEAGVCDRVGNPVIVVFPSLEVLDNASEILRTIYPDDEQRDMKERAEERRERRESETDGDDVDLEAGDDDRDRDRNQWEYLSELHLEPGQLASAIERDHVDDDHVRVRTDPYDWLG